MKLDDLPRVAPDINLLPRQRLEEIALALAAREREVGEISQHLARQQDSLAELRGLLLRTLWPRRQQPTM